MGSITLPILIATGVTGVGIIMLLVAVGGGGKGNEIFGSIANYGEPGWGSVPGKGGDGAHLASTEMVQFESHDKSPLIRVIQNYRDGRRRKAQQKVGPTSETARRLALAQLQLAPTEWVMVRLAVCLGIGAVTYLRLGNPYVSGLVGLCAGFMGTKMFLARRVNKRQAKFEKQLLDVIGVISAGMRAGSTFAQALEYVSGHVDAPAGPEFARVSRESQLGIPMDECLYHLAERNESNELKLLVNALVVNRRVGGNLTSILEILGDTIRTRMKIKGDVKTLTAQARASGWVIAVLPLALLGLLMLISPSYVGPMFTNPLGIGILVFAGICIGGGMAIMQSVVKVKV